MTITVFISQCNKGIQQRVGKRRQLTRRFTIVWVCHHNILLISLRETIVWNKACYGSLFKMFFYLSIFICKWDLLVATFPQNENLDIMKLRYLTCFFFFSNLSVAPKYAHCHVWSVILLKRGQANSSSPAGRVMNLEWSLQAEQLQSLSGAFILASWEANQSVDIQRESATPSRHINSLFTSGEKP